MSNMAYRLSLEGIGTQQPQRMLITALKVWTLVAHMLLLLVSTTEALPEVETTSNDDLFLVTGNIELPILRTAMEYVSVDAIMGLQEEAQRLNNEIKDMATLTAMSIYDADNFCPNDDLGVIEPIDLTTMHGGTDMARYVTPYFSASGLQPPFIVTTSRADTGALQCHYALSAKFKEHEDQLLSNQYYAYGDKSSIQELVTPYLSCPNDEIHTGFYTAGHSKTRVSHSAPLKTTTNAWARSYVTICI